MAVEVTRVLSRRSNPVILVIDGDNTLWDTNKVFTEAQTWLVDSVLRATKGAKTTLSLELLRRIDDVLVATSRRQEYDFRLLVLALLFCRREMQEEHATMSARAELRRRPRSGDLRLAEALCGGFKSRLEVVPPLLPSVNQGLEALTTLKKRHKDWLALVLFSEGNETRIRPILQAHSKMLEAFDAFHIVARKTQRSLVKALRQGLEVISREQTAQRQQQAQVIVVGDSIKSDIVPGNLVGATTVYIPGGYRGLEVPSVGMERPVIVLDRFAELPRLVENLLDSAENR